MSFPLKRLLALYENSGTDDPFARGHGASAIVAFFTLLGIPEPTTADLSKNLVLAIQDHIRAGLPTLTAEACIEDARAFLEFLSDGYTAEDWSQVLAPKREYVLGSRLAMKKAAHE